MYIGDMHGYAMLLLFFSLGFLAQQIQVLVIFLIVSTWRGFFDRLFALERGFFRCSNPKMSMPSWPLGGKAGWRMFHHRVPISNLGHTWTLQGVSNGLPHTTYRLPLSTPGGSWYMTYYDATQVTMMIPSPAVIQSYLLRYGD